MSVSCSFNSGVSLVTGGGGYVGNKLCLELLKNRGYKQVIAFDVFFTVQEEVEGLVKIKGDVCDFDDVVKVVSDSLPCVIFHLASYGMSGREMRNKTRIEAVNISGTQNILRASIQSGVQSLVYTSTYNVVFGGQEIRNGNESLPYFPLHKHVDHYSRTKAIAEEVLLSANGTPLSRGGNLKVCALRCAGIYGEGEQRHLPRIVSYIERGLFCFTYGDRDNLVDYLHVDNFVMAHCLAADALIKNTSSVIGKPFYISDGNPVNSFLFFKPLVDGLGYSFPSIHLPLSLAYYIAYMIELLDGIVGKYIYSFTPFLTRAEVLKTGVTHYFSIQASAKHLGYQPETKDLKNVVDWFKNRGHGKKKQSMTFQSTILVVAMVIAIWCVLLSLLPVIF